MFNNAKEKISVVFMGLTRIEVTKKIKIFCQTLNRVGPILLLQANKSNVSLKQKNTSSLP